MTGREERQSDENSTAALRAQLGVGAGECRQQVAAVCGLGEEMGAGRGEQLATESEFGGAVAVGQEAVIADALEAGRHHVLKEAADEFLDGDGHQLGFAGIAIIFPLERDLTVLEGPQTAVGDGHAMGVAAEILQDVVWSSQRRLGVDHPFFMLERRQVAGKGIGSASGARSPKKWSSPLACALARACRKRRRKRALRTLTGNRNSRRPAIQQ